MKKTDYELCERCEKILEEAGSIGMTIEEMLEQEVEFGIHLAVDLLKNGYKITRKAWNDKDIFLYYIHGFRYPARTKAMKEIFGEIIEHGAYIAMKTEKGNVIPWSANQNDLLAEDYIIVK